MQKKFLNIIVLLSVICFTSCEYYIDYNDELKQDKMVVTALFEEGEKIKFDITHSAKPGLMDDADDYFKNDRTNAMVKDADVKIMVNGNEYTCKYSSDGYTTSYIPQANDVANITISHPKYPTLQSTLQFNLNEPKVDSFWYETKTEYGNWSVDQTLIVYFEIDDDGKDNYYKIDCNSTYVTPSPFYNESYSCDVLYESHPGVFFEQENTFNSFTDDELHNDYGVFSNKKFKNEKYCAKLRFHINSYGQMYFNIRSIDKNSFNYLYDLNKLLNAWEVIVTPISIRNAWEDGYGFIGVKKTKKFLINISNNL